MHTYVHYHNEPFPLAIKASTFKTVTESSAPSMAQAFRQVKADAKRSESDWRAEYAARKRARNEEERKRRANQVLTTDFEAQRRWQQERKERNEAETSAASPAPSAVSDIGFPGGVGHDFHRGDHLGANVRGGLHRQQDGNFSSRNSDDCRKFVAPARFGQPVLRGGGGNWRGNKSGNPNFSNPTWRHPNPVGGGGRPANKYRSPTFDKPSPFMQAGFSPQPFRGGNRGGGQNFGRGFGRGRPPVRGARRPQYY